MVTRRDWLLASGLFLAALFLRLWAVSYPPSEDFDEVYYVDAAESLLNGKGDPNWVHPPLGKLLIAGGIMIAGDNPFGWRLAPVLSGAVCVLLVYLLSLKLFNSRAAASMTSLLLMLDPLSFVQSRIAMLDIFLPLFSLAACLFLVQGAIDRPRSSLWFALSGLAIGAGISVKWSLVPVLFVLSGSVFFMAKGKEDAILIGLRRLYLFFLVIPIAVYLLSYFFLFTAGGTIMDWLAFQGAMLNYHFTMKDTHPDALHPLLWWVGQHLYYVDYTTNAQIWAQSNPFTWLPGAAAAFYLGFEGVRQRRLYQLLPILAFAAQYFMWFLSPRIVFIFYILPIVPFLHLSLGYCLARVGIRGRVYAALVAVYLATAVLLFALDYSRLTGLTYF